MMVRQRGLVQALMALVVAAACGSESTVATISPTPTSTPQATPTPTPHVSPTPIQPSPIPSTVLDDRFGFLVQKLYANDPIPGPIGWSVRHEGDPQPLFPLHSGSTGAITVSPDGRRLAYWTANELRVLDVAQDARPRTLLTLTSKEGSFYMAWSSDGTGLVIAVAGGGGGFADAPPGYTALRVVDVAGGQPREIVRMPNASLVPLAWDRQAHVIAAYEPSGSGARSYVVVEEDGTLKRSTTGQGLYIVEASRDGQQVLARGDPDSVIRVWPRASFDLGVELRSTGGEHILDAGWRPGTAEVGVLFANRLELWTASGARRTLALPKLPALPPKALVRAALRFRADGRAAIVDRAIESGTTGIYSNETGAAIDLASGVVEVIQWGATSPGPGWSVRIDSQRAV